MALPWLESFPLRADVAGAGPFPKRFGVMFMGNGINGNHWWARGSGPAMKLGKSLEPLEPLKGKINVINGLFNKPAVGMGIHPGQTGNILSGVPIQKGAIVKAGISVDQVLAKELGQDTAQASIVLACEHTLSGYHETNFSMAYSSHISWYSADSPVPNEIYPSLAFDSLFENRGSLRNQILDRVKERAGDLSRQVSSSDKTKVDEYLTSAREVERGIEVLRNMKSKADEQAEKQRCPVLTMERPQNGLPEDLREHSRLMTDIMAMALQTDKTRIASLLLARDLSGLHYPFLGVKGDHHSASYDDLSDGYERITRYHLSQFAHLAQRLNEMPEGEGTVLDNCCLLFSRTCGPAGSTTT